MQYLWGYAVPVRICSTRESYPQYLWVISSVPVRICIPRESHPQYLWVIILSTCEDMHYPWVNLYEWRMNETSLTGTAYPHRYCISSRVLRIWRIDTEDMTHGYCISSQVLRICLTGNAYPHRYWGYDSQVLRIWLTGDAYPHGYWGYDWQVLRIWLTGTAYPHGYWGYDSQIPRIWLTGTEDMTHRCCISSRVLRICLTGNAYPHRYWGYDSQVMNILTGTAYSLYRVVKRTLQRLEKFSKILSVPEWVYLTRA